MREAPTIRRLCCLLITGCAGSSVDSSLDAPDTTSADGVLIIADSLEQERILLLETPGGSVLQEIRLDAVDPDHCRVSVQGQNLWCLPYEVEHSVGEDGVDRLLAMYSPALMFDEGYSLLQPGVLSSIALGPEPSLEWSVDRIDLSGVPLDPEDDICQADPKDPCHTEGAVQAEMFACALRKPHGFSVLERDEQGLRVTVTDTRNHRILDLVITKGERCAAVDRVASASTVPDWTVYKNPNDIESWIEGDTVHNLVSFKGSDPDTTEQGAAGRGKLMLLSWEADGQPEIPWVFPPLDEREPSFLNGQHNVDMVETEAGDRLLLVAHSGGANDQWHTESEPGEEHGSVLLTSCCDEAPTYLLDAIPADMELGYLRDVDLVAGGHLLLTDSGCLEPEGCPVGASVNEMLLPDLDGLDDLGLPNRDGNWSTDHGSQNLYPVQTEPYLLPAAFEDLGVSAYEADWVPAEQLGESLTALLEEAR